MKKIKVCGMREIINAYAVSETGPDLMGFIFFNGSGRYVGIAPDPGLFQIPPGILKTGVFVDETTEKIIELAYRYGLQAVQLHGNETVDDCQRIKTAGYVVIKAFGVGSDFDFTKLVPYRFVCDYFLFDTVSTSHGGSGRKFNWQVLNGYSLDVPFFVSGGISAGDVDAIGELKHPMFFGVDINSRFESTPGIKDIEQVRKFIQEIKNLKP
jgi:phosphoribosylanthranilate isomerase